VVALTSTTPVTDDTATVPVQAACTAKVPVPTTVALRFAAVP